ncbi:MAG: DUF2779 domain-containing protein [Thermodesulfobacteriota bacterium]
MPNPYRLSKSKMLSGLQCRKRLYLEVHHPELAETDSAAEQRMAAGTDVGEVARNQFPGGVLVDLEDGDFARAIQETGDLLTRRPMPPVFEGTFSHGGVLVRADVLAPGPDGLRLIEVKSSTSLKDYHLLDCGIQLWVIESAGHTVPRVEVAHIDSSFLYLGGGDYRGLFRFADVTEQARYFQDQVPGWVADLQAALAGPMPEVEPGNQCHDPFDCPFLGHCAVPGPEYPVHCLPRGRAVADALLAEGIEDIRDIPPGRLSNPLHERVREATVSGLVHVDPELGDILAALPYPRYSFDFETIAFAVPIWAGTRPYQQIPFQWSCHVEDAPGQMRHEEFLDLSGDNPSRPLLENLLAVLGDAGPVLHYSAYEKTMLNTLRAMHPDLAPAIDRVLARLNDLLPLVREHYYHPAMKGSWSIKAVLPAVAPELDYSALEEVQDGTGAQAAYLEAIDPATSGERKNQLLRNMLEYCKMDTLAMVRVLANLSAPARVPA